jgi:transcriptional regulator with XRE-family HTH domain
MIPMTKTGASRTIRHMGRGITPTKIRSEIAKRLKAARVVAGFPTQREASDALGIRVDRYEKWESGRTPVPAQYVGPVCALFNVDANYLFDIQAAQQVRKAM